MTLNELFSGTVRGNNMLMKGSTYFGLLAEFGEAEILLDRVCEKYFGLSVPKAKRRACLHQLPVRAYRGGSQKSPWLINAIDLAQHIDERRSQAAKEWASIN